VTAIGLLAWHSQSPNACTAWVCFCTSVRHDVLPLMKAAGTAPSQHPPPHLLLHSRPLCGGRLQQLRQRRLPQGRAGALDDQGQQQGGLGADGPAGSAWKEAATAGGHMTCLRRSRLE
jgi:hypothetical protein